MAEPFVFTTPRPWETEAGVMPTPEELGAYMGACTDEERVEMARRWQADSEAASVCIMQNHQRLHDDAVWLSRRAARYHRAWQHARLRARVAVILLNGATGNG